jgi:hypothetical protein
MYHVEHCKHSQKSADRAYNSAQVSTTDPGRKTSMPGARICRFVFHLRAESIFRAFYGTGGYRFANTKGMAMRQSDPLKNALQVHSLVLII